MRGYRVYTQTTVPPASVTRAAARTVVAVVSAAEEAGVIVGRVGTQLICRLDNVV